MLPRCRRPTLPMLPHAVPCTRPPRPRPAAHLVGDEGAAAVAGVDHDLEARQRRVRVLRVRDALLHQVP